VRADQVALDEVAGNGGAVQPDALVAGADAVIGNDVAGAGRAAADRVGRAVDEDAAVGVAEGLPAAAGCLAAAGVGADVIAGDEIAVRAAGDADPVPGVGGDDVAF